MRGDNRYAGLATPENTDAEITAIVDDPETHDWVKRVAVEALSHDCVDAVVALEVLAEAFKRRNSCIYEAHVTEYALAVEKARG